MSFLDDEDLPFTIEELRLAATMWLGKNKGKTAAEAIVASVPGYVASRDERRTEMFKRRDFGEAFGPGTYMIPDELLAFISTVSEDAATRVEVLLVKRWWRLRQQYIGEALGRHSRTKGARMPTDKHGWRAPHDIAREAEITHIRPIGQPPKPPTSLVRDAEARLRIDVANWRSLVKSLRQRVIR